jgi:hypothetical protein
VRSGHPCRIKVSIHLGSAESIIEARGQTRGRLDDREHGPPIDHLGEHHERDPRRIVGAAGLDLAFSVECHLLAQKESLHGQLRRDLKPADTNLRTSTSKRTAVCNTIDRGECFRIRHRRERAQNAPLL